VVQRPQLDSIARLYLAGPSPGVVTRTPATTEPIRADPHLAEHRVIALQTLLARIGAVSIFRDERYPGCLFIRLTTGGRHQAGYLEAGTRCVVPPAPPGSRLVVTRVLPPWYIYEGW